MASNTLVVRGRFGGGAFIPDGPLPDVVGAAELVITAGEVAKTGSIWDAIGKVHPGRTGEDIAEQLREDRAEPEPNIADLSEKGGALISQQENEVLFSEDEPKRRSVWDAIGKMSPGRTAEDIFEQMRVERDSWGDR